MKNMEASKIKGLLKTVGSEVQFCAIVYLFVAIVTLSISIVYGFISTAFISGFLFSRFIIWAGRMKMLKKIEDGSPIF